MKMNSNLEIYTIYWDAKDFPGEYVVRKFTIAGPDPIPDKELFMRTYDVDEIHDRMISMGLTILPRGQDDDKAIVCSYI
jgi:hypothetical protein